MHRLRFVQRDLHRSALERVVGSIRDKAEREITLRRADGSETRLSTRELAMACAAVLG